MLRVAVVAGHVAPGAPAGAGGGCGRGAGSRRPSAIQARIAYTGGGTHDVAIANGREVDASFERDGFTCAALPAETAVIAAELLAGAVTSPSRVAELMYPVVERTLRAVAGASKVFVFDHIYRDGERLRRETEAGIKREDKDRATPFLSAPSPNLGAHNDYTVRSGITRPHSLLAPYESKERRDVVIGDTSQIERLGGTGSARVQVVNFWWPLANADATPLAVCRWRSIQPRDVQTNRILYKHRADAETYRVHHSPAHEWVYYPGMTSAEALIFKQADSSVESSRFSFHAAFDPPAALAAPGERVSLEFRAVVLSGGEADVPSDFGSGFVAPHLDVSSGDADARLSSMGAELLPRSDDW